jgi:protein SCO1/2
MEKTAWHSKRNVRIGILLIVGFMIGAVTSYMTALNKYNYYVELKAKEEKAGQRVVRDKDGNIKIIPVGKPDPGKEIPQADPNEKTGTPASTGGVTEVVEDDAGVTREFLEKQKLVKAHTMPPIGMFLLGNFSLKDHNGKDVTEKSWPGKYLLVYFGYSHCPDVCPVTLTKMEAALEKLGPLSKGIQPLFITIDPARDTPEKLKEYVGKFGKRITGLTGTDEQIKTAKENYSAIGEKREAETQTAEVYNMDHSAYIYLMSPDIKLEELFRIENSTQSVADRIKLYLIAGKPPKQE